MEQIYMIPVNEAFDACGADPECGCPLCKLYKKLQEDELDIILGASMMEPDVRLKTNEQGFCLTHYNLMLGRRRMLGMGLMLESHLCEVDKKMKGPSMLGRRASSLSALSELEESCYVCKRTEKNMNSMIATVVYLWELDYEGFRKKLDKQPWFCLPHYRALLDYASRKMSKKLYPDFHDAVYAVNKAYIDRLKGDVSLFCKSFDYGYDKELMVEPPKDAVKRAVRFLGGCFGEEEQPVKRQTN